MMDGAAPLALDTIVFARGLMTRAGAGPALAAVDLDVIPGEIFSIVGRAGAGKSTLLEALVGLKPISGGRLEVCGTDPRRFSQSLKQRIGIAPRHAEVDRAITVDGALRLFASFYERADPDRAASRLQLEAVRHRRVDSLPASWRQRVSLALALLNDPVVLFADEPTRELDPEATLIVWGLLRERRERGRTSVITTNHLDEAARLSDRVAILHSGRLIALDTPAALVARSTVPVCVTLELMKPHVSVNALQELQGVIDVRLDRSAYILRSRDGYASLRAVVRLLENMNVRPLSLGLRQQTLEDVFFELTADLDQPPRATAS